MKKQTAGLNDKTHNRKSGATTSQACTISERLHAIEALLEIVAAEAVQLCISSSELHKSTDRALVRAALRTRENSKKKPNRSQIAAQTGLSRPEVSQLLLANPVQTRLLTKRSNRILQTHDYILNRESITSGRRDFIRIPYCGSKKSFSDAVRSVGGDIPPAAMLKEFMRRDIARITTQRAKKPLVEVKRRIYPADTYNRPALQLAEGMKRICGIADPTRLASAHLAYVQCQSFFSARQFAARVESKLPVFLESLNSQDVQIRNAALSKARNRKQDLQLALVYWQGN